jgi:preprotein translocase subunit SecA
VLVPFTDGKKQIGVSTNLQRNIDTGCRELILSLEKISTLAIIDQLWKEHLREMDDLKQSVQNAVYEQKDPLLIYKFEAFELFKRFLARVNEDTISFLTKADLPVREPDEVQEARNRREARKNYRESKEESKSLLSGGDQQAAARNRPPVEKALPRKVSNLPGRNDRVSVQYEDGTVKKDVKFKTVEQDVASNKCVLIED